MSNQTNTLSGLSLVLLLCILDHLDSVDIVCLSLCNRELYDILRSDIREILSLRKHQSFLGSTFDYLSGYDDHSVPQQVQERMTFLQRLAHDLSDFFVCHACFCLHQINAVVSPWTPAQVLKCWQGAPSPAGFDEVFAVNFYVPQHVAERARHGDNFGVSAEMLGSTTVDHSGTAFIFNGSANNFGRGLHASSQVFTRNRVLKNDLIDWNKLEFCSHAALQFKSWDRAAVFDCGRQDGLTNFRDFRCSICGIEFILEFRHRRRIGKPELLVTKWINFGGCESPLDSAWPELGTYSPCLTGGR